MRNTISNLLTPKGRWLPTLLLLFTLGIGNVWAADPTIGAGELPSAALDISDFAKTVKAGTIDKYKVIPSASGTTATGEPYYVLVSDSLRQEYASKTTNLPWVYCKATDGGGSHSMSYADGLSDADKLGFVTATRSIGINSGRYHNYRIKNCTSVTVLNRSNGTKDEKRIWLNVFKYNSLTESFEYQEQIKSAYNSSKDIVVSATLNASDEYVIQITSGSTSNSKAVQIRFIGVAPTSHTVTYKSGDGSGDDVVDDDATVVGGCPSTFSYTGYDFAGWKDGDNNDVEVGDAVTSDMTLTAQWTVHVAKYTVKYLDGTTELGSEEVNVGSTPAGLASNPTKDCYTFAAWSPALSSVSGSDGDVVEVNATWTPKYASTLDFAAVTIAGTTGANPIGTFLASGNMVASNLGGDSGWETSTAKSGFIGYKLKNTSAVVKFLVKAGKEVEITLGSVGAAAKLNKGGVESEIAKKSGDNEQTVIPAFVAESDMLVTITTNASSNSTVTLKKISIVDPAPKYTVTYALNGATGTTPTEVDHKAGEKFNLHDGVTGITAPTNKTFVNWKDQDDALFNGGAEYTMPAKNVTMTAQWAGDVYTVKFMDGETVLDTKVVEVGSHPTDIEHPTKPLYTFAAWQLSGSDVVLDNVNGTKDATVILTARWAVAYALDVNFKEAATQALGVETALNTYHYASDAGDISFEEKGLKIKTSAARFYFNVAPGKVAEIKFGNISGATYSVDGGAAETLTSSQLKATYSASAQSCVMTMTTAAYNIVEKITIHDPYTVSFDANGGDDVTSLNGTPSVTLPSATKGTDSFLGWFDAAEGGNLIGEAGDSYTPTADIELFAHWEAISTDARLASITFSAAGTLSPTFDSEVTIYTYTMPYKTAAIPTITGATSVNANAQDPIIGDAAAAWGDAQTIKGVAQSGDKKTYTITMLQAPKDGVSIIKVATTGGTNKTVTGVYAGDGDVNLSSSKKMDKGKYIGFTLNATALQAGDKINVHTTQASSAGNSHIIFYDNMTDKNELYDTEAIGGVGDNIFTINADMVGKTTAYVYRASDNAPTNWNGYVDYIEVTRAMDPVLKAISFNSVDATKGTGTTFSAELPYGTNLGTMTITPEIIWNGAAAENSILINGSATGAWAWGANTYKLTDKDGDATTYTITLTEAAHYEAMIVGGANYTTLVAAVAAAQADDVVKLLDNVDLMATGLTIAENMTLDLNGYNIKAGEQLTNNINVPAGVKLTLVDNSANAEGKIYTEEAYAGANTGYGVIRVAGEFLMQSGNIYAVIESDPANLGQFAVVLGAGGKATIEGGQIKAGWYAISNNGNNTGSTIIVSGGELISTADFAIYNPAKESTVTVSGGVVYGAAGGIAMNRGELTVTGGTITSKDQGTTGTWGDGTGGLSNAAISASGKYESVEVEITGGTIIAEGTAVMITNGTTNPVEVAISGGQFSHVVPAEYCAEGFAPVTTPNAQSKYEVEDKRIYIFNGTTSSATMATSPSGAIAWEIVGSTMGEVSKSGTYDEVNYVKALQLKNSSTTKHFRIDVDINNNAKIEVIGKSNSSDETRHAWLTNSTEKGEYASAIAGLASSTSPAAFATDWLEEGSYYLHADESVNIFLIRVTEKAVDPKCEVPTITAQPETNITFGAGDMTATIEAEVSDGGTLKYQWYNAEGDVAVTGQTTATLTTAVEGTYYVIVTNTLDNHRNNSIKSAEAQLAHRVMNDATLSALSYGGTAITLEDGVYTYDVELAKGTTDVPALAATATMAGYANVTIDNATEFVGYAASSTVTVKSEDQTVTKVYTVNFTVKHDLPQVDVTASTVWDMNNVSADPIELTGSDKNARLLLANIDGVNNTTFNAQALMFEGQHIGRTGAGIKHLAGRYVQFNVTVPGAVFVTFESNGNNARTISINGKKCARTTSGTAADDYITYALAVEPGSVEIIGYEGESANQYVRISKIEFKAADESRANLQLGGIGTVCLPFDVATTDRFGGTFYKADYQGPGFAYFIEETGTLEAGKPYVYVADTTFIVLLQDVNANTVTDPTPYRGMYGTFTDMAAGSLADKYVIAQKKLRRCGAGATLAAYRAYIDLTEMPTTPLEVNDPANAPVRRRLGIGGNNGSTTDLQNYFEFDAEGTQKVIMNGQLYILRDGKMYNAQGQLMK